MAIRISFINSVYYARDAISLTMQNHIKALTQSKSVSFDIQIYVTGSDIDDPRIRIIRSVGELLRDAHFSASEVLVFHWGVYHELYDFVFATLPCQRVLCYFHNITPSRLFTDPRVRSDIAKGERQIDNLYLADFVFCNSDFSRQDLLTRGLPHERMEVLYPAHIMPSSGVATRSQTGTAQLLYVGRFVPHKGAQELLLALAASRRERGPSFNLKLIGPKRYSDPSYMDQLRRLVASSGLSQNVEFLGEVSDSRLSRELSAAHALVMPSYHEGFGLPVIEALNAGCYVIAFDGGNLSHLLRDVGVLVPAGDVNALRRALDDFNARMTTPIAVRRYPLRGDEVGVAAYESAARRVAARFTSYTADQHRFTGKVLALLEHPPRRPITTLRNEEASRSSVLPNASTTNGLAAGLSSRLDSLEAAFLNRRQWLSATDDLIKSAANFTSAASRHSSHRG